MSETDPAIIGVQSCGCITFALARETPTRSDEKALAEIVREGGQVIRTTVGEARAMPHFLVGECPHDPKGWERTQPKPTLRKLYNGHWLVEFDWVTIGHVRKPRGGDGWEARAGFDQGAEPQVLGVFTTRRAAVEAVFADYQSVNAEMSA